MLSNCVNIQKYGGGIPSKLLLLCLTFLTIIAIAVDAQSNSCTNPNRISGRCISVYDCPSLIKVLERSQQGSPLSTSQRDFMRASQCRNGSGRDPHVCCTKDDDYTTSTARTVIPGNGNGHGNGKGNVLPLPPDCGPISLADKIYNGKETALDEYPWMVLLEYTEKNGNRTVKCGGSLINQRYVLTAAHCVVGQIETQVGPLAAVRLGEYDTSTDIDCIVKDCNEKTQEFGIEETIPHPEYRDSNQHRYHDIALVRLNADVTYTYFIRPVCLPLANVRKNINIGEFLTVAGWGRTLTARQSNVKQHLSIPVADHAACKRKFATRRVNLIEAQLCAGGDFAKDSCDGDSGGPLMRQGAQDRWFLEGIVSFGNRCGLEGWPAVYTLVADYTDWIQSTIRP